MGYLLKETLKTLCGVKQWSYAVFWKIGFQNPNLLIWEECYYSLHHAPVIDSQEQDFREFEACWPAAQSTSRLGVQAGDQVHNLVTKMMADSHVSIVGEGLIGHAAFTGSHSWILSENYNRELHPPEVLNEVKQQFAAGMKTVTVIPVLPHGVIQLGSSLTIMENGAFVNDVKSLFLHLGCIPGVLLSANYATNDAGAMIGVPDCLATSVSIGSYGKSEMTSTAPPISDCCNQQINSTQLLAFAGQTCFPSVGEIENSVHLTSSTFQPSDMAQSVDKLFENHCEGKVPLMTNFPSTTELNGVTKAKVICGTSEEWLNQQESLHIPISRLSQQLDVGQSTKSDGSLRLLQQQVFSDAGVQSHNSGSASSFFMMSQPIAHGGTNPSFSKDSVSTTVVGKSELYNNMGDHQRAVSNICSLSDLLKPENSDILCPQLNWTNLQVVGSSKSNASLSNLMDHLKTRDSLVDNSGCTHHSMSEKGIQFGGFDNKVEVQKDLFQARGIPCLRSDDNPSFSEHSSVIVDVSKKHDCGSQSLGDKNVKYEDLCVQSTSGNDLFDILGAEFKNKLSNGSCKNFLSTGLEKNTPIYDEYNRNSVKVQEDVSNFYSVNEGNFEGSISSMNGTDQLLEAVISRVLPTAKQILDDSISCRTTLTDVSSSSVCNVSPSFGRVGVADQRKGELFGLPNSSTKSGAMGACLSGASKENSRNYSQRSSIYESQISSWVEQAHDVKQTSSVSTAYSKKPDEPSKSSRKRLKPGENPRPRPKDRQLIQDRVKDLREIVPNGAKCSIDALLEHTIKHMLFLQSIAKHADKLKQAGESKIIKEGGLLLKDHSEGGATWAYEVGSQSMVCPIIVEDLNLPRHMFVEMLCEERGLFLEIADIIRGLELTILKGVMETRDDKIWARFAVEANRDVTRMEIFVSLVRLLDPTMKGSASATNDFSNDNIMVQQFHQAASIPATCRPL